MLSFSVVMQQGCTLSSVLTSYLTFLLLDRNLQLPYFLLSVSSLLLRSDNVGEAGTAREVPVRPAAASLALPAELVDSLRTLSNSGEASPKLRLPISAHVGEWSGLSVVCADGGWSRLPLALPRSNRRFGL